MRSRRLFVATVSVALVLAAGSPALAHHGKDPKPPKSRTGVSGGGVTTRGAEFSVEARPNRTKGHFHYTSADERFKVRCRSIDSYSPIVYVQSGPPAARITAKCVALAPRNVRKPIWVDATFFDNGKAETSGAARPKDRVEISFFSDAERTQEAAPADSGELRRGNIRVR